MQTLMRYQDATEGQMDSMHCDTVTFSLTSNQLRAAYTAGTQGNDIVYLLLGTGWGQMRSNYSA